MRLPSLLAHSLIRFRLTEIFAALFCQHNVAFAYAELMHARTSTDAFYCAFRRAFSRAFSASPARLVRAAGGNAQHVARPRTTGREPETAKAVSSRMAFNTIHADRSGLGLRQTTRQRLEATTDRHAKTQREAIKGRTHTSMSDPGAAQERLDHPCADTPLKNLDAGDEANIIPGFFPDPSNHNEMGADKYREE